MTSRVASFTVVLDKDLREDDPDLVATYQALMRIKGVISVEANVADISTYTAYARADNEWRERIANLLKQTQRT